MDRAIDRPHAATCARPEHLGPCEGPLRYELPETAAEREARQVAAVAAVLRRTNLALSHSDEALQRVAEECVAAAETGI